MGAGKKKTGTMGEPPAPTAAEFTVVLEDIRSQFKVFGEALDVLRDEVRSGFKKVDARFEKVDGRLDLLQTAVLDNSREIRELRGDLARKVDRDEVVSVVAQALARR